jgi:hypothetical protein
VAGEAEGDLQAYGPDRLFVGFRLKGDDSTRARCEALKKAGKPAMIIDLERPADLAGQFFLWEMAAAVAGRWLRINPFDQPDVSASKKNTEALLEHYRRWGGLPGEKPVVSRQGISLYGQEPVDSIEDGLRRFAGLARPGDYMSLQAFLAPEPEMGRALRRLADSLRRKTGLAVTLGFGPRYLHSTGQLHKGDAGRGLFLQLTSAHDPDLPVSGGTEDTLPSVDTFGVLIEAQALGDFRALQKAGRRIIRLHFDRKPVEGLALIEKCLG